MCSTHRKRLGYRLLAACACLLLTSACTTTLSVNDRFPEPVVASLPIDVGVYYSESLKNYQFEEEYGADGGAWHIELGQAHVRLFDELFDPLFERVVAVKDLDTLAGAEGVGLIIEPAIDTYTLGGPMDSGTGYYEVTIRYSLHFYSPQGEYINRWQLDGHGRIRAALFSNDETVEKATVAAMRDAAAGLLTEFETRPELRHLLQPEQVSHETVREDQDS